MIFNQLLITLSTTCAVFAKPNIVIFLADDLGYGDLGCYGNTSVRTPHIDSIAREGAKMTQHLAAASVCTPSRAALLTGRYPIRSGMVSIGLFRVFAWPMLAGGLPPAEITFAEQTKQAGYQNGFIGKWHLGMHKEKEGDFQHHPLNHGFDYFYGLIGTNLEDFGGQNGSKVVVNLRPYWYYELFVVWAVIVSALWSMKKVRTISISAFFCFSLLWSVPVIAAWQLMDNYILLASFLHRNYDLVEQPIRLAGLSQRLVNEGVEFVQNSTKSDSPFLLVMSWSHMHVFLETEKQFEGRSKLGKYGDALEELDWSVGEILNALEKEGITNNTLVYFTSDNGGHFELGPEGGSNSILKGMAPTSEVRINLWIASRTGLPPSEITFAELTKEAGYRNALIGKWHLGHNRRTIGDNLNHPLNQGFDYFYGLVGTNFDDLADDGSRIILKQRPYFNYQLLATVLAVTVGLIIMKKKRIINVTMFILLFAAISLICFYLYFVLDNLVLLNSMLHRNCDVVEQPIRHVGLSKRLVHEGLEFMRNTTDQSKPFLLVMSFVHVHTALFVSKEFAGSSKHGIYGDAVHEMDWSVGRILEHLDETNQRNNTLVYFMSDHGAHKELGTHGGFNGVFKGGKGHGAPEGSIRVPGLFRWPGVLPAGKTIDVPISTMDIFPLVAQTSGVTVPTDRPIDGKDILKVLKGDVDKSPHEFMFHYCDDKIHATRYIPTTGNRVWKYVTHLPDYYVGTDTCRFGCVCSHALQLDPPRLYDITGDPSESSPIDTASQLYEDITIKIKKAIDEHKLSLEQEQTEKQFSLQNVLWRYSLQECCNGTFPFNCQCEDSKFPPEMYE